METLVGYLNLKDSYNFQEIYSSQLYGTFFSIFARFKCNQKKETENHYFIDKIDFKIINYKGNYNLGITRVEDLYFPDDSSDTKYVILKVEIQALKGDEDCSKECKSFKIPKKDAILHFERRLARMYPDNIPIRSNCFDDEFYYREGVIKSQPIERSPLPLKWDDEVPVVGTSKNDASIGIVGGSICPRRLSYVL